MEQIMVINGTTRENNISQIFSKYYYEELTKKCIGTTLIYPDADPKVVENHLQYCNKVIFVIPEYNGSFPGQLKLLIDTMNMKSFNDKKIMFTGISAGRNGNVRGVDHLTDVMLYLKAIPFHDRIYLSQINDHLFITYDHNITKQICDNTKELMNKQLDCFIKF